MMMILSTPDKPEGQKVLQFAHQTQHRWFWYKNRGRKKKLYVKKCLKMGSWTPKNLYFTRWNEGFLKNTYYAKKQTRYLFDPFGGSSCCQKKCFIWFLNNFMCKKNELLVPVWNPSRSLVLPKPYFLKGFSMIWKRSLDAPVCSGSPPRVPWEVPLGLPLRRRRPLCPYLLKRQAFTVYLRFGQLLE